MHVFGPVVKDQVVECAWDISASCILFHCSTCLFLSSTMLFSYCGLVVWLQVWDCDASCFAFVTGDFFLFIYFFMDPFWFHMNFSIVFSRSLRITLVFWLGLRLIYVSVLEIWPFWKWMLKVEFEICLFFSFLFFTLFLFGFLNLIILSFNFLCFWRFIIRFMESFLYYLTLSIYLFWRKLKSHL